MVLIVAPHTSWKDIIVGLAARSVLKAKQIKFPGKKELFNGPFGWFSDGWVARLLTGSASMVW